MLKCFDRIKEIAKGLYGDEELRQILKDAENQLGEKEGLADLSNQALQGAIQNATDKLEKSVAAAALRVDLGDLQVARSAAQFEPFEKFTDSLKQFARSLTFGTGRGVEGAKSRTLVTHLTKTRMNGRIMFSDAIDKVKDGRTILTSSEYETQIVDAANGKTVNNPVAQKVGEAVRDFRKATLKELEKHGVVVSELEDRGIQQSHDAEKLLQTAGTFAERTKIRLNNLEKVGKASLYKDISFNRWKDFMDPRLDLKRTFGEGVASSLAEKNRIYREIYDNITSEATSPGKSTVQKQVNAERFFHFKDTNSQLEYNKEYGRGTLFDSLMQEADSSWNKIGILQMAGDNPMGYIEKTIRLAARQSSKTFTKAEINAAVDDGHFAMSRTLGHSTTVYGSSGKLVKAVKMALFAKIAPTLLPLVGVADVAPAINVMAQLGGRGLIRSSAKLFGIARKVFTKEEDLQRFVDAMGFKRDIQMGSIEKWAGVKDSDLRGRMMQFMMKLSPHEFMNHVESLSAAHELTLMLGQHASITFKKLPNELSKTLKLYGIDEDRWNVMRTGTTKIGGVTHLTTDAMRGIDKEKLRTFLKKKFNLERVSDFRIEQERDQTQQLFTQMVTDKMATASNLIDARQRSLWNLPFDQKTTFGRQAANLFSLLGSLRYYETAIVHRTLAPLIYGEQGESVIHQIISGKFDKIGMARWAAVSFTTATMAFTLQELMRGKEPDPSEILARSLLAPLGIIGQGLEIGKGFGHDALQSAVGPGPGLLFNSVTDLAKVMRFDHPVKNATNLVTTAIPGFNSSLGRQATHHLVQYAFGNHY